MEQTSTAHNYKIRKWYNSYCFPLIPQFSIKDSDKYNTSGFTFQWLIFKFWSLDSFQFELALVASTHWGIGFNGMLPYLRWVISIPCPEKLGIWIDKKLGRHPENKKQY